ncbi:MAG: signal peptidase I [Clostridiales bacterium]|nr:signal peptidase I [Clostridiales bacterium]
MKKHFFGHKDKEPEKDVVSEVEETVEETVDAAESVEETAEEAAEEVAEEAESVEEAVEEFTENVTDEAAEVSELVNSEAETVLSDENLTESITDEAAEVSDLVSSAADTENITEDITNEGSEVSDLVSSAEVADTEEPVSDLKSIEECLAIIPDAKEDDPLDKLTDKLEVDSAFEEPKEEVAAVTEEVSESAEDVTEEVVETEEEVTETAVEVAEEAEEEDSETEETDEESDEESDETADEETEEESEEETEEETVAAVVAEEKGKKKKKKSDDVEEASEEVAEEAEESDDEKKDKEESEKEKSALYMFFDTIKFVAIGLLIGILLVVFVIQRNDVYGSSMEPTLYSGDAVFVEMISIYTGNLDRGDIVTIDAKGMEGYSHDENLIKRIIGLPGETIKIEDGNVYINGQLLDESDYLPTGTMTYVGMEGQSRGYAEVTLGPDEYYCMGDNRGGSNDSRRMGPFKKKQIEAKVLMRIYPFNKMKFFG